MKTTLPQTLVSTMPNNRSDDPSLCAYICGIPCAIFCYLFLIAVVVFPVCYFVFLIVFLPQDIKFTTYQASLTQFNLTNTTLFYDLSFNVSIRNPNHKPVGIYLYKMEAKASYDDTKFATAPVSLLSMPYYLGHKNTTFVHPFFQGQQLLSSKDYNKIIKMYNSEASTGDFSIGLKLDLQGRLRFGKIKTSRFKNLDGDKLNCKLVVPLRYNGTSKASHFEATSCGKVKTRIAGLPLAADIAILSFVLLGFCLMICFPARRVSFGVYDRGNIFTGRVTRSHI